MNDPVDFSKIDRLPPHSIEAEQGVLGCVLLSPNEAMGLCLERLRRGSETFYDLRHEDLFDVLVRMYDARDPIDLITLQQRLKDNGQLEAVGGLAYLTGLMDAVPSAANLEYYLGIIVEKAVLRRMIQTCSGAIGRVHEYEGDVAELISEFQSAALAIGADESAEPEDMKSIAARAVNRWQDAYEGKPARGIPCSLPGISARMPTFRDGRLHIIGARPSKGKSSLLIAFAEDAAAAGFPVGLLSLEMTQDEIFDRIAARRSGIAYAKIEQGTLTKAEFDRLTVALSQASKLPIFIRQGSATVRQVQAITKRWVQKHGIRGLLVDYLSLIQASNHKASLYEQATEVSKALKQLALTLRIPVICAAQLNRDNDRQERAPRLSDFRDSGSIEQDADIAMLLHEPTDPDQIGKLEIILAKYRNGQCGKFTVGFNAPTCTFTME